MLFFLLYFAAILLILHILLNYNRNARLLRKIPGLKDHFIVGDALAGIKSPVELFRFGRELAKKHNGIYRFWCFPLGAVFIYNPDDVEIILTSMKYHEKSIIYKFLKPWLNDGLLLSGGSKWLHRRKILTPAFHFNILRQYLVSLEDSASRLVDTVNKVLNDEVDLVPLISECTLQSICESAMGTKLSDDTTGKSYKEAIHKLGFLLVQRFIKIYLYADFFFNLSALAKKQNKYLSIVHNFTRNVIKERKKYVKDNGICLSNTINGNNNDYLNIYSKKRRTAMLDLLILAEKDGLIDSAGIEEEVDTFMFEGHDTTAAALTYCLMLIANYPDIQNKIVAELKDIYGETKRAPTIEDLNAMRYLERCIKEAIRLYPPVPFISRKLNDSVQLSNYTVPAGTLCHIHIYDLHRLESLYPNPLKFDPDRFLPENVATRHNYAYIPFSAGPRNCIGQKFAMMQMKTAVSAILLNFKLLPVTGCADLQFQSDLILRNSKPVYAKFVKRE
ncbi:PREDICTED: cytochrome P450 4C1-like [Papilio polytes]|uniref:cytochrome P450 4C1-like n=1 Tax=Papilio polytes TaxID=76194 RepID=UPI00067696CA|nr:PREDICTED: cytochrome P450 4C1-like [Papilio polytes]